MAFLSRKVSEYRMGLLNTMMDQHDLDGVVITGADFFQFFTNFHLDVLPWERPVALVISRHTKPFALMNSLSTNHIIAARKRDALWIDDITIYYEFPRDHAPTGDKFSECLAERLSAAGLTTAKLATDVMTAPLNKTATLLGNKNIQAMGAEFRQLRWVKHPEELAIMREIANLSDWIQDRYRENIRPGRLVQEMDMQIATMMVSEAAKRFPGENLEVIRCYTLSGLDSACPHSNGGQTGATIAKGDVLVNIIIPRLNGVTVENERVWFCGKPSEEQIRYFNVAHDAQAAAIDRMRPGNSVSSIDEAARNVFKKAKLDQYILHRTGHGIGLIGHEFPENMPFCERPLLKDEVYSAEPGIYIPEVGGFRFDDIIIINQEPEIITKAPKDLKSQTVL